MKAKPTWEYFTERGERKKKLKIATVTGREVRLYTMTQPKLLVHTVKEYWNCIWKRLD